MSESDQATFAASPRRREQARAAGQVAVSHELTAALVWLAVFGVLAWIGAAYLGVLRELLTDSLGSVSVTSLDQGLAVDVWRQVLGRTMYIALPLCLLCVVVASLGKLIQVGVLFVPNRVVPDFGRVLPSAGLSRLGSLPTLVASFLAGLRSLAVIAIGVSLLWTARDEILALSAVNLTAITGQAMSFLTRWGMWLGLLLFAWGVLDYGFQRWRHERSLRMTPEQLRAEVKAVEGNAQVSSGRRELAREMSSGTKAENSANRTHEG